MSNLHTASLLCFVIGCGGGGASAPPPNRSPTDSATVPTSPTGMSTRVPSASTADTSVTSPTGDTAMGSSGTTADTGAQPPTAASTGDTAASTSTATTGTTGDTGMACDAIPFGPTCYVEDGLCYAPNYQFSDTLTDGYLDYLVDQTQSGCGSVVATTCDDGAVALARWGRGSETGDVDIYDSATRQWVAGYIITDDPYVKCGEEVWIGDPDYQACGEEARQQMYAAFAGGCGYYTEDASGACTVLDPACVIDEVKRP